MAITRGRVTQSAETLPSRGCGGGGLRIAADSLVLGLIMIRNYLRAYRNEVRFFIQIFIFNAHFKIRRE